MVRNSGKFGKPRRGGGKHFTPARTLAGEKDNMWGERNKDEDESDEDDSDEEEESDEEDEDDAKKGSSDDEVPRQPNRSLDPKGKGVAFGNTNTIVIESKEDRKAQEADSDDEEGAKPAAAGAGANANRDAGKARKISSLASDAPRELSRREKEAQQKKAAAERYRKLHEAGKTDEARADLARLAKIRAEREASAAKTKAEKEAKVQRQQDALQNDKARKK